MKNKKVNVFIQNLSDTTTVLQQLRICIEEIKKAIALIDSVDLENIDTRLDNIDNQLETLNNKHLYQHNIRLNGYNTYTGFINLVIINEYPSAYIDGDIDQVINGIIIGSGKKLSVSGAFYYENELFIVKNINSSYIYDSSLVTVDALTSDGIQLDHDFDCNSIVDCVSQIY